MMMSKRNRFRIRHTGCSLLIVACVVTAIMLQANRIFVIAVYAATVPNEFDYARVRTVLQFLLMIALLLPEWWLLDRLTQLARSGLALFVADTPDEH